MCKALSLFLNTTHTHTQTHTLLSLSFWFNGFSIFTRLCSHRIFRALNSLPPKEASHPQRIILIFPALVLGRSSSAPVSRVTSSRHCPEPESHTMCLAAFTWHNCFRVYPWWSMHQFFIPFYWWRALNDGIGHVLLSTYHLMITRSLSFGDHGKCRFAHTFGYTRLCGQDFFAFGLLHGSCGNSTFNILRHSHIISKMSVYSPVSSGAMRPVDEGVSIMWCLVWYLALTRCSTDAFWINRESTLAWKH